MTAGFTVAMAVFAAVLWALASYHALPSAAPLDAERWFKTLLATVLRGEVEAQDGDAAAWEARVKAVVPYHPLCRDAERLLGTPEAGVPGGAPRPGERALVDALAALEPGRARWDALFGGKVSLDALLDDPHELGPAYDPAKTLGPAAGWDQVANLSAGMRGALDVIAQRVPARWVIVDGPGVAPSPAAELQEWLGTAAIVVPWPCADLAKALADLAPAMTDRLVLVLCGEAVPAALRALAESPPVRDRTLAVLSIGGVVRGWPGRDGPTGEAAMRDWLDGKFRPDVLDTERSRATPWMSVQWTDPAAPTPGVGGLSVHAQRFPPPADAMAVSALDVHDLGVLPHDAPRKPVAAALIVLVSLLAARAGR